MRSLVIGAWVLALGGCGSSASPGADAGAADSSVLRPLCGLTLDPPGPLRVRTREEVTLRAAVRPAAAQAELRFGLVGDARDASLTNTRALTDPRGESSLVFLAPSSPASFRIRASVGCGADSYVEVSVGDRGFGAMSVTAEYRGVRQPSRVLVALYRGADCAALPSEADRELSLPPTGGTVPFGELPAGVDYAVRAVALGDTSLVLAQACAGPLRVETDQSTSARLVFTDLPLRLGGLYDLSMRYELSALAAGSAARWRAAAAAEILNAGGDRALLGAELTEAVVEAAPALEREAARTAFVQSLASGLGEELTTDLSRRGASLVEVFGRLSNEVAEVLSGARSTCVLRASAPGERDLELSVERVEFTLDPSTPELSRDDVVVPVRESATGRLRFALGDHVDVALSASPMPYGRLELASLGALLGRLGVASSAEYVSRVVCPAVWNVVRGRTGACEGPCVAAACRRAVGRMGALYEVSVMGDGRSRTAVDIGFSGGSRAAPGGLVVDRVSGPALGAFVGEPGASLSALATLSARAGGS